MVLNITTTTITSTVFSFLFLINPSLPIATIFCKLTVNMPGKHIQVQARKIKPLSVAVKWFEIFPQNNSIQTTRTNNSNSTPQHPIPATKVLKQFQWRLMGFLPFNSEDQVGLPTPQNSMAWSPWKHKD